MPVNMDPAHKRRRHQRQADPASSLSDKGQTQRAQFGEETDEDRAKALADAEKKNLWDATEVIDMDTF